MSALTAFESYALTPNLTSQAIFRYLATFKVDIYQMDQVFALKCNVDALKFRASKCMFCNAGKIHLSAVTTFKSSAFAACTYLDSLLNSTKLSNLRQVLFWFGKV